MFPVDKMRFIVVRSIASKSMRDGLAGKFIVIHVINKFVKPIFSLDAAERLNRVDIPGGCGFLELHLRRGYTVVVSFLDKSGHNRAGGRLPVL